MERIFLVIQNIHDQIINTLKKSLTSSNTDMIPALKAFTFWWKKKINKKHTEGYSNRPGTGLSIFLK